MKAIGVGEQPLPRIVLGRSSLTSASVPKLMIFCFSCWRVCCHRTSAKVP